MTGPTRTGGEVNVWTVPNGGSEPGEHAAGPDGGNMAAAPTAGTWRRHPRREHGGGARGGNVVHPGSCVPVCHKC